MDDKEMRSAVERVLAGMDAAELEQRIAPVKCDKNPEAPECQVYPEYGIHTDYGVDTPLYGVGD
ncbi:MAG: hypothetical protein JXR83_02450 [Deltaproteobacteria bacterium]|nr:hypothetical protein [Deltaproteobacteria bacterium]